VGYSLDGEDNVTIAGNTTLAGMSDGTHNLVVYAEDIAGDVGASETIAFTVDSAAPSVTVDFPESRVYDVADVPLVFVVNEPVSQIAYSLDGQDNVTVTGNVTLNGLSSGAHSITVYAWDNAGNVGASETVTFNTAEPKPGSFPTSLVVAGIVSAIVVGSVFLVYFKKRKH